MKLPDAFGAPTSEKPIVLTPALDGQDDRDRRLAPRTRSASASRTPSIGPIGLNTLVVTYDGEGLWEIAANVQLPVLDAYVDAKAGILNGDFNYAGAEVGFGSPGRRPVRPGLPAADQVPRRGRPEARASASRISASRPRSSSAFKWTTDYGVPTFALCGEVGLTGGPSSSARAGSRSTPGSASPPTTTARRSCAPSAT